MTDTSVLKKYRAQVKGAGVQKCFSNMHLFFDGCTNLHISTNNLIPF